MVQFSEEIGWGVFLQKVECSLQTQDKIKTLVKELGVDVKIV